MNIIEALVQLRDDLMTWTRNNLVLKVDKEEFNSHLDSENPHNVTTEQIGALSRDDIRAGSLSVEMSYAAEGHYTGFVDCTLDCDSYTYAIVATPRGDVGVIGQVTFGVNQLDDHFQITAHTDRDVGTIIFDYIAYRLG